MAAYLADKGVDVALAAREKDIAAIKANGLKISGVRGEKTVKVNAVEKLEPGADLVVLSVKTQDITPAVELNLPALKDPYVLTVQNGVRAEEMLAGIIDRGRIISSVVLFGSTYLEPGCVVHNFEGGWALGRAFAPEDDGLKSAAAVLSTAFTVHPTPNIMGMKWLKLFLNMNNCLPALTGLSMQETFASVDLCRISIRLLGEALTVVGQAGIKLTSLPDFPKERIKGLTEMPLEEASRIFSQMMTNLSREPLYGSILQSIKRGKPSEIDYFNGEVVRLGDEIGTPAPLNRRLVEMVHKVEQGGGFLSPQEIISEVGG